MFRILLSGAVALALFLVGGCVTPSATSSLRDPYGNLYVPKPKEADQYSDFLIGRYATLINQSDLAAETAKRAYERTPENGFLLERAVTSLLLAGQTQEAVSLARSGLRSVKDIGAFSRLTLAADDFRQKRYEDAGFRLKYGELDVFNRMVARSLSAWAAVGVGEAEQAKTHLIESLVGDNLFDGVNLYMLAFVLESTDQKEEALETFSIVWEERMRLAIAAEHYAKLLADAGRSEEALKIVTGFQDDMGINPSVDALIRKLTAQEPVTVQKLTAQEGAAVSLFAIGSALASQTKSDITSIYLRLALHVNPDLDTARMMLARSLSRAERSEDALETLKSISDRSIYFSSARSQMGWVLVDLDRNAEAINVVESAYAATQDRDLAIQAGNLHYVSDNFDQALAWYNRIIGQDIADGAEDWQVYYTRGLAFDSLNRWPEAEADLLKSLSLDPDRAEVLNYLGYSWVDRGVRLEEAFDYIKKAVALRPDSGAIVDSLGWAYFRLGQFDLAVQYLETAASLGTSDPVINDHLGDAYWRTGRYVEAKYQWSHAVQLETDPVKKAEIEAKLTHGLDASRPVKPEPDTSGQSAQLP